METQTIATPADAVAPDLNEIKRAVSILFEPNQIVELRSLKVEGAGTISGYYSDFDRLAENASRLAANPAVKNLYVTLNPPNEECRAKVLNIYKPNATSTTGDANIERRAWLLIDCDPHRQSGCSSTDDEKQYAKQVLDLIVEYLRSHNFNEPVQADSGNGYHALYKVDLPNDAASRAMLETFLKVLDAKFSTDKVAVDKTVFNASRICKLYGSVARKGENTLERPHRLSRILCTPEQISVTSQSVIQSFVGAHAGLVAPSTLSMPLQNAGTNSSTTSTTSSISPEKMEEFLSWAGFRFKRQSYQNGYRYILEHCEFNPEHCGTEVAVILGNALGYKCQHNSCSGNNWVKFRAAVEKRMGSTFRFPQPLPAPLPPPSPSSLGFMTTAIEDDEEDAIEPVSEPLPEFPTITGSIHDLATNLAPDLPYGFKVMAAMTRIGLMLSKNVHLAGEPHLQPRFFTALIAQTGYGKSASNKEVSKWFDNTSQYEVLPSVDSGQALVEELSKLGLSPKVLWSPDELTGLFQKGKTGKSSTNTVLDELLKLLEDNTTGNLTKTGGSIKVNDAHLAIISSATPSGYEQLWTGTSGSRTGLQSRFTLIGTNSSKMPLYPTPTNDGAVNDAQLLIFAQVLESQTNPVTITLEPSAKALFSQWWDTAQENEQATRLADMVKRFLMVLAVTNGVTTVDDNLMRMGIQFGTHTLAARERYNPPDASSYVQAMENAILRYVEKKGAKTANALRKGINPRGRNGGFGTFKSALKNLIDTGEMVECRRSRVNTPIFGVARQRVR